MHRACWPPSAPPCRPPESSQPPPAPARLQTKGRHNVRPKAMEPCLHHSEMQYGMAMLLQTVHRQLTNSAVCGELLAHGAFLVQRGVVAHILSCAGCTCTGMQGWVSNTITMQRCMSAMTLAGYTGNTVPALKEQGAAPASPSFVSWNCLPTFPLSVKAWPAFSIISPVQGRRRGVQGQASEWRVFESPCSMTSASLIAKARYYVQRPVATVYATSRPPNSTVGKPSENGS